MFGEIFSLKDMYKHLQYWCEIVLDSIWSIESKTIDCDKRSVDINHN